MDANHSLDGLNQGYEPTENEETVLTVMKAEQRATPLWIREQIDLSRQRVNEALQGLLKAGWIRKLTKGFYEFVADPR